MKRKLDESGEPAAAGESSKPVVSEPSFNDLGLDARLVQAIAHQKFRTPTLVQQKAIPLGLNGKDVLAKAKTGSGKTLAYLSVVLQGILRRKQLDSSSKATTALILAPTRELCDQILKAVNQFSAFCANGIHSVKLTDTADAVQRSLLSSLPDIVISTPAKAWQSIEASFLVLGQLSHLVLDEADLLLGYGYSDDLEKIAKSLPKGVQATLMSATLTTETNTLKDLFCRNPAVLDLKEPDAEGEGVAQYFVKCSEDEKFLLAYVIFKLQLIKGKCIIFVADVDRCYRLKLFFQQFGIRSCILNSELPVNSRIHIVEQFNRIYDIIIASDENEVLGDESQSVKEGTTNANADAKSDPSKDAENDRPKKKKKFSRRDKEYGVSRGIDFKNVAAVLNFDLPTSSKSYIHRIGRTARAGQTGMALSFVVPTTLYRKHMPTTVESAEHDEKILGKIVKQQGKLGKVVKPYNFDMKQVEAFRYRMNDALRAVTKVAIREARIRELRQELLTSEKLKRHFEENPSEKKYLIRHDGELRTTRENPHLRDVPDYLLPPEGKKGLTAEEIGFVPMRKTDQKNRKSKYVGKGNWRTFKAGRRRTDPLQTFRAGKRRTN